MPGLPILASDKRSYLTLLVFSGFGYTVARMMQVKSPFLLPSVPSDTLAKRSSTVSDTFRIRIRVVKL